MQGRPQFSNASLLSDLAAKGLQQNSNSWLTTLLTAVVILVFVFSLSAIVYHFASELEWLYWPGVVVLVGAVLLSIAGAFVMKSDRAKLADTARTTIRGASQGVAQVAGRIKPIAGCELRSDTFDVPCVMLNGSLKSNQKYGYFSELKQRHGCVVYDEHAEVFVPGQALVTPFGALFGTKTIDQADQIPAMYRQANPHEPRKGPWRISETLLPVGVGVEVLGGFLTIKATDSYLTKQAQYRGEPAPTAQVLEESPDERDWRLYADALIAQDSATSPTPAVNVMVQPRGTNQLQVVVLDGHGRMLEDRLGPLWLWLMAAPPALFAAYLLEYTTPAQTMAWLDSLWQAVVGFL